MTAGHNRSSCRLMSGRYVSPYGQCVSALTQVDLYNEGRGLEERRRKGKEEYLYNAILYTMYISKQSDMDHTVLPANTPCLPALEGAGLVL